MIVSTKEMLKKANQEGYAVGAFNVEDAEMMQAVLEAAEAMCAPVILQTTPGTLRYMVPEWFAGMYRASKAKIPVALHLDHGSSSALAQECIQAGYTSVMIDGSALPYEENIQLTQTVCGFAHAAGVSVEAELGRVGGKEDDLDCGDAQYTDPAQAADFATRTQVDSLAVAVGTAHGVYAKTPVLDLNRITQIKKLTDVPIVLHGASGLSDEVIRQAVEKGAAKINFATELRIAYSNGIKGYLAESPDAYDPKKYLSAGKEAVGALVKAKIRLCGCDGKAHG